jgi:hypothetical protein
MSLLRSYASPPWIALGVLLGFLAFAATATLYPALWRFAGLAVVLGAAAITAPLEHRRRDHTAHTAFVGS